MEYEVGNVNSAPSMEREFSSNRSIFVYWAEIEQASLRPFFLKLSAFSN